MSVTLKSITIPSKPLITDGDPHIFILDCNPVLKVVKSDVLLTLSVHIRCGFKCDGASVPKPLQWFLPSWAKDKGVISCVSESDTYNIGSCVHDGLYIHKGFGLFTREECDDILRGIWRESGIGRFKAGVADLCVGWFAGGSRHWGNDGYGVKQYFDMEF